MSTYLKYKDRRFSDEDLKLVRIADEVSTRYEEAGMRMTLRQLHYQLVTKNVYANTSKTYQLLKRLVRDGRMAGLISWTAIEDRVRNVVSPTTYDSPVNVLEAARDSYKRDLWTGQHFRPALWCEKDALAGILEPIAAKERVEFLACRGYASASALWEAGQRFAGNVAAGQRPVVIHLGDHDAWGINMTSDNRDRLATFAGVPVLVVRIALNMDQVERWKLPPNVAKESAGLGEKYVRDHGESSWEVDALEPSVLRDLVVAAVGKYRDPAKWDAAVKREAEELQSLDDMIEDFGGTQ